MPILDLKYFAKYIETAGFKLAIDGFHNMPDKGIFIAIYCLNPPGVFYKEDDLKDEELWDVKFFQKNNFLDKYQFCF